MPPKTARQLNLKFRQGVGAPARDAVRDLARRNGAADVRPLFPGEKDDELASLFVVDLADPATAKALRKLLEGEASVEYVEEEVSRKPR